MPMPRDNMYFGLRETMTREQIEYVNSIFDNRLTIVNAKAGTGKTTLAVGAAKLLGMKLVYVFAPVQEDMMGFRPGSQMEKEREYTAPLVGALIDIHENPNQVIFNEDLAKDPKAGKQMMEWEKTGKCWCYPRSHTFARGINIENRFVVIDECFVGDTKIMIENERPMSIKTMYNKYSKGKQLPKALSYNEKTETFEYKQVLNAVNKGLRNIITVKASNRKINCTPDHPFLTTDGWVEAGKLTPGDLLITTSPNTMQTLNDLNDDQYQLVLASSLGDGGIQKIGLNRYRVAYTHGIDQEEYCKWKAKMFGQEDKIRYIEENGYSGKPAITFASKTFAIKKEFPAGKKKNIPQWILDEMDDRAIAIWFMDDGNTFEANYSARISVCAFDDDTVERMMKKLKSIGVESDKKVYGNYPYITLNKENFLKLKARIAPYVHPSLAYKMKESSIENSYKWNFEFKNNGLTVVDKVVNNGEKEVVYDIEVQDNHNFAITSQARGKGRIEDNNFSGIIVHNCQNFTHNELRKVLTRIHDDCKVIMIGHSGQCDLANPADSGFEDYIELFRNKPYAKVCTLTKNFRGELAQDADTIDTYLKEKITETGLHVVKAIS